MFKKSSFNNLGFGNLNPSDINVKLDGIPLFRLKSTISSSWNIDSLSRFDTKLTIEKLKEDISYYINSPVLHKTNGNNEIHSVATNTSNYNTLFDYVFNGSWLKLIKIYDNTYIAGLGFLVLISTKNKSNVWIPLIISTVKEKYLDYIKYSLFVDDKINGKAIDVYFDKKLLSGSDPEVKNIRIAFKKIYEPYLNIYNCRIEDLFDKITKVSLPKFKKPSDKNKYLSSLIEDALLEQQLEVDLVS